MSLSSTPDNRDFLTENLIYRVLDILAALLVSITVDGIHFPFSDVYAELPWVSKFDDPSLFPTDICHSTSVSPYYFFSFGYLFLLSKVLPIGWVFVVSSLATKIVLFVALSRLATRVHGRFVPVTVSALLMSSLDLQLLADYRLVSRFFTFHSMAVALIVLALAFSFDRRKWVAASLLSLAVLLNPRLGVFGACIVLFACAWEARRGKGCSATWKAIAVLAVVLCLVSIGLWLFGRGPAMDSIARIMVFVRCPFHYLPSSWGRHRFVNLGAMCFLMILLTWRDRTRNWSALWAVGILCGLGIVAAALNDLFLVIPFLTLVNPLQLGMFLLAFFYVCAIATVMDKVGKGYYASCLLVFMPPSLQMQILFVLLLVCVDCWPGARTTRRTWIPDLVVLGLGFAIALAMHSCLPKSWLQDFRRLAPTAFGACLVLLPSLIVIQWRQRISIALFVVFILIGELFGVFACGKERGIIIASGDGPKDWKEVCDYVRENASKRSCFVVPPSRLEFQYLSKRSAFCTEKHIPFSKEGALEWFERLKLLGVIPPELKPSEIHGLVKMDTEAYFALKTEDFLAIKKRYDFVDYCIVELRQNLDLPLVYQNEGYRIYQFK